MPTRLANDWNDVAAMLNDLYPCPPNPQSPPIGLIKSANDAFKDIDSIGPQYLRTDLLARFEKAAFDGARLRAIVDNSPVTWLEDNKALKQAILHNLDCGGFSLGDALAHLRRFRKWADDSVSVTSRGHKLSDSALVKEGWVHIQTRMRMNFLDSRGTGYRYAIKNSEWAAFFIELRELDTKAAGLSLRCLSEGRVLAIKQTSLGGRLVNSTEWQMTQRLPRKDDPVQYVLTGDLPDSWLYVNLGPRGKEERMKKKSALRWLNDLYQKVAPTGKKATKQDVFHQLSTRFQIKGGELQKEIWKEASIDGWRKGGAPGAKKKYRFDNER